MLARLYFEDHLEFQRNTLYWTLAGAAGALLGLFLRGLVGPDMHYVVMLGTTGLGLGVASGLLSGKGKHIAAGAGIGLALGVVAAVVSGIAALGAFAPLVGMAVGGIGAGLVWGSSGAPRVARSVGYAIMGVVGLFVAYTLLLGDTAISMLALPGIQDALTGGVLGFFLSLGGAVGRIKLDPDPLKPLWDEISGELEGDMAELARQGYDLYTELRSRAENRRKRGKDHKILADVERVGAETAERLLRLAQRWCQIERTVDDTARPRLNARLEALEAKIASVSDPIIVSEYGAAAESIRRQLAGFDKIDLGRERLVARMHRCLAALERISLMLLQLSTSDAQDAALNLQPELELLDEMSDELSWKTLSVEDLMAMDNVDPVAAASPTAPADDGSEAIAETATVAPSADDVDAPALASQEVDAPAPASQEVVT
jgi:hypothetical protein